ncbi:hypothetical protein KSP40_PGU017013 [Platanthera guangdongensis]|uniref:Uncharacterized protein n=1 Tax=Platanthera guangdongensis TaxID=2320717 RepID=A0ABR2N492_9ASPA
MNWTLIKSRFMRSQPLDRSERPPPLQLSFLAAVVEGRRLPRRARLIVRRIPPLHAYSTTAGVPAILPPPKVFLFNAPQAAGVPSVDAGLSHVKSASHLISDPLHLGSQIREGNLFNGYD